jgi:peptidoglycan-N-acetylglucosamine deacetylase
MMKLENEKIIIRRRRKKRKYILLLIVLAIFLGLIFYTIGKINKKKNIVNINNKNNSNNIIKGILPKPLTNNAIKDTQLKPPTNVNMNARESKVTSNELNTDSSTIDVYKADGHKIAYLTFDDGPSANTTPGILKTLDNYNVKATFFIIGNMAIINSSLVKMEAQDGQSIGNHTYSHNYQYIYSNTKTFINDVNKCDIVLKTILGNSYNSKLVRFPGGSFGTKMAPFRKSIKNAGYHYIDWNDLTGDAEGQNISVDKLLANLKTYTSGKEHVVILMHDASTKKTTVQALPQVIEYLESQGYAFNTLK